MGMIPLGRKDSKADSLKFMLQIVKFSFTIRRRGSKHRTRRKDEINLRPLHMIHKVNLNNL
jgi:hypothetical protein